MKVSISKKFNSITSCLTPKSWALFLAYSLNPLGSMKLSNVTASISAPASLARWTSKVLSAPPEKAIATFLSLNISLTLLILSFVFIFSHSSRISSIFLCFVFFCCFLVIFLICFFLKFWINYLYVFYSF